MKNSKKNLLCLLACALAVVGCKTQKEPAVADNTMLVRSTQTLDSLYAYYSAPGTCLLRENCPSDVEAILPLIWLPRNRRTIPIFTLIYGLIPVLFPQ